MSKNFTKRSRILLTLLTTVQLQNISHLEEGPTKVIQFKFFYSF